MADQDFKDVVLLKTILEAVVTEPNAIVIDRTVDEQGVLLTFEVAQSDRGLVLGKEGRNINAIRMILSMAGHRLSSYINVKMKDDGRGPRTTARPERSEFTRPRPSRTFPGDEELKF